MLSSQQTSSTTADIVRDTVKSLTSSLPTAESKTPESEQYSERSSSSESNAKSNKPSNDISNISDGSLVIDSDNKSKLNPLSSRALKVKSDLSSKDIVTAVILRSNGNSEEIEYNTSSASVNKILGGRPTIIGELEDIQVIIVRLLSSYSKNKELNKNILPTPFCNKSYNGDYLLYRVNSNGKPINLKLDEYNKYIELNKKLTEQARKNYNPVDEMEIKPKSMQNQQSRLTLIMLRSEADRKVREEFKEKYNRNPSESEVEDSVNLTLQNLIDELVQNSSSPMNDPDYKPEEDKNNNLIKRVKEIYEKENGVKLSTVDLNKQFKEFQDKEQKYNDDELIANDDYDIELDEKDWRLQLNEALKYVRERGRADGKLLAHKISETFVELNGNEPTLDQLIRVFRRIKNELSEEAKQDIILDKDNGSAYSLAKKLGPNFNTAAPSDLVDYAFRIVREDLISRAKSSFEISRGRTPNKLELESIINRLTEKLAKEAINLADNKVSTFGLNNSIEDIDGDYDPNNVEDQKLLKSDIKENELFDRDYFNLRMLSSPYRKSSTATKYNVYFCKFNKKRENKNLLKAIDIFKLRNKRSPNLFEINNLKKFLNVGFGENKSSKLVQFKLSVVSDDDANDVLDVDELNDGDNDEKLEYLQQTTPTKVLVTPIKNKKSSARYNVYFGDSDNFDFNKSEKFAIKWFKRFNSRNPTKNEIDNIKKFVSSDINNKSGLKVCNFNVPIVDDSKDDSKEDNSLKMKTSSLIKKHNNSTRYTLDFDDNTQRDHGDNKRAIKWFKRFNNRSPKKDEKERIKKFVVSDNNEVDDVIDID